MELLTGLVKAGAEVPGKRTEKKRAYYTGRSFKFPIIGGTGEAVGECIAHEMRASIGMGVRSFIDDTGAWQDVDLTHADPSGDTIAFPSLVKNIETQFFKDRLGERVWKPNPYASTIEDTAWVDPDTNAGIGDYWLERIGWEAEVESRDGNTIRYLGANGVRSTVWMNRSTVPVETELTTQSTPRPEWTYLASSNLERRAGTGSTAYEWVNEQGDVVFKVFHPRAWSKSDKPRLFQVAGRITLDEDGHSTTDIDLSGLQFPVILDPSTSLYSASGDGGVRNLQTDTWANVIAAASGDQLQEGSATNSHPIAYGSAGTALQVALRSFLAFDCSGVTGTATGVNLLIKYDSGADPDSQSYNIYGASQASTSSLALSDFSLYGTTAFSTATAYGSFSFGSQKTWTLNSSGIAAVQTAMGSGYVKFSQRISADYTGTGPSAASSNYVTTYYSESATDPQLDITYTAAPVITSITPSSSANSATALSITDLAGTDLSGSSPTVKLTKASQSDINATAVTQVSSIKVTCTFNIQDKATGTWNVVYTDSGGTSTITNGFTISQAAPSPSSITPSSGANLGSVNITDLAGHTLGGITIVKLKKTAQSDINASAVTVVSQVKVTCTVNLSGVATGTWDVYVENGTGNATLAGAFTVTDGTPAPTSCTPSSGAAGNVTITNLAGTNFTGTTGVVLRKSGQSDITATSVVVVSDIKITCVFPCTGAADGYWDIRVTNAAGTGTLSNGFQVHPGVPNVTSLSPTGSPASEVLYIRFVGSGFTGITAIWLSKSGQQNIRGRSVNIESDTVCTGRFDLRGAAAGAWTANLQNSYGTGTY